jgi:hypothetical protein
MRIFTLCGVLFLSIGCNGTGLPVGGGGLPPGGGATGGSGGSGGIGGGHGGTGGSGGDPQQPAPADPGWIAFDALVGLNRDLYAVRTDGSDRRRLTDDPAADEQPVFAPDGWSLAFVSDRSGTRQIHVLDLASGRVRQITHRDDFAEHPAWSADGGTLAFHSGASVYLIGAGGEDERMVVSGPDLWNAYANPIFVADDSRVIADRGNMVVSLLPDGSDEREIIRNTTTTIGHPSLSANGAQLVAHIWCEEGLSVWMVPAHGSSDACRDGIRLARGQRPRFGADDEVTYEQGVQGDIGRIGLVRQGQVARTLATGLDGDQRNPAWAPANVAMPPSK